MVGSLMTTSVLRDFLGDIAPEMCNEVLAAIGSAHQAGPARLSYEFNTTEVTIDVEDDAVTISSILNPDQHITLNLEDFVNTVRLFNVSVEEFRNLVHGQLFMLMRQLGFTDLRFMRSGALLFRALYQQGQLGVVVDYDFGEQSVCARVALIGASGKPIVYEDISERGLISSEHILPQAHWSHDTTVGSELLLGHIRTQMEYYEELFRTRGSILLNEARRRFNLPGSTET